MKALFLLPVIVLGLIFVSPVAAQSQTPIPTRTARPRVVPSPSPSPEEASAEALLATPAATLEPRLDITQNSVESIGPLEQLLENQQLEVLHPGNVLKYAIRSSIRAGVPPNTIVLLLLVPFIAAVIAAARHLVGLRGFGIFLPAALSVVFLAIGPIVGIGLFVIIISVSTFVRVGMKKLKLKLQYLPRMALILWFVILAVLVVLFAAPILRQPGLGNVSIFPVLILVLLAEDFTRVQLGKSAKTAINVTSETLILALVSYILLVLKPLQEFALLNPEIFLITVAVGDFLIGRYVGLRVLEIWRFRKLIK